MSVIGIGWNRRGGWFKIRLRWDRKLVGHGRDCGCHFRRLRSIGGSVESERALPAGRRDVVDLLHVNLQVVGPLEHLAALAAGVWHKSALVLVPHMPKQRALKIEATAACGAAELDPLGRLAH